MPYIPQIPQIPEGNHDGRGLLPQWHERLRERALQCATRHSSPALETKIQTRLSVKLGNAGVHPSLAHELWESTPTRTLPQDQRSGRRSTLDVHSDCCTAQMKQ